MTTKIIWAGLITAMAAVTGSAQAGACRDPWVTQAVTEVTGRPPTGSYEGGDCNIANYGGGHWSSYADLLGKVRARLGGALPALAGTAASGQAAGASLAARSAAGAGQGASLVNTNGSNIVAQGGLNHH